MTYSQNNKELSCERNKLKISSSSSLLLSYIPDLETIPLKNLLRKFGEVLKLFKISLRNLPVEKEQNIFH